MRRGEIANEYGNSLFFFPSLYTHTPIVDPANARDTRWKNDDREAHHTIKFMIEENPVPTFSFSCWVRTSPSFFQKSCR